MTMSTNAEDYEKRLRLDDDLERLMPQEYDNAARNFVDNFKNLFTVHFKKMRPLNDDLFSESGMELDESNAQNLLLDLASNEKAVHQDFFNEFDDLFDDDDLN